MSGKEYWEDIYLIIRGIRGYAVYQEIYSETESVKGVKLKSIRGI